MLCIMAFWVQLISFSSCCLVAKLCSTLCYPMDCNMPGFPIHHQHPEFAQIHVHWVSDAIQQSHRCSLLFLPSVFPSIRVFSNELVFASGGQSFGASSSALVLPINIQDWFPLGLTGLISLRSKRLSRVFASITVWKHQFFSTQVSLWSNSHIHIWLLEKP